LALSSPFAAVDVLLCALVEVIMAEDSLTGYQRTRRGGFVMAKAMLVTAVAECA
jgi:hypothetical protein